MAQSNKAEIILHHVFSSIDKSGLEAKKRTERFYVISGHNSPRWIVPINPKQGKEVLAYWRPYGVVSQIAWFVLQRLYSLGMVSIMHGIEPLSIQSNVVLQLPGSDITVSPVVYVGTPGPQQKAVVTLVDQSNGKALAVMKVALEAGARKSLNRESDMLKSLDQLGMKSIPKLLATDEANGRTWQTVVSGRLSSRKLTDSHISWLLSLPKTKKTTTLDKQKRILFALVDDDSSGLSSEQLTILKKAIERIKGNNEIPLVLVHGDFAPWNIKQQPNAQLAVIDWEDAELEGLPLWDLCHFYFMQAYLFGESEQLETFISSSLINSYLRSFKIAEVDMMNFVLLYLLETVLKKDSNTSNEYQEYLIKQILRLAV